MLIGLRLGIGLALSAALLSGCTTRSQTRHQAQEAYVAGQQRALDQQRTPIVRVAGEVRHPIVPWTDGLTLAQAILAADYRGLRDPRQIIVIRDGARVSIDVRAFLRGDEDPLLLPGDIIELHR